MTPTTAAISSVQQVTDAREGNACPRCRHTFQSPSKLHKHQTETKNQCKVVIKDLTCEHCEQPFATQHDLQRHHHRKQKACILIQELKAAHQEDIDKLRQELAAKQQQLDLLNANVHDLQDKLKAVKAAPASMSNPLEELLLQKITDISEAVSEVKAAVCSGSDSQNLAENSVCSTYEEVRTATRLGASSDITSHKSGIATTTELTSIPTNITSCNVVDEAASVRLDTHVEPSSEAAHQDLMGYAHASHSTTLAAMNTTVRVADETVIGRLRDEVSELENCFGQASTLRMPVADSQSKARSMQSFARGIPNQYGKESWDYWHDIEYKELMKVLKIKSCKTKAWEPDSCVLVNFVKLFFATQVILKTGTFYVRLLTALSCGCLMGKHSNKHKQKPPSTSWLEMSQPTYGISRISSRGACCWTFLIILRG